MERGENGVGEEGVRPLPWEEKKEKLAPMLVGTRCGLWLPL